MVAANAHPRGWLFILAVAGGVLTFNEPDGFRGSPITDAEARLRRAADLRYPPTDWV